MFLNQKMIRPGFFNLIIFLRLQGFRVSASLKCQEVHPILPMVALFFFLLTVGCLLGACLADPGIIPRREVSGCVWVFGGRLGVVDSCSDVSSMDGFTMLMFQFHAWVQGNLLGESYLFHPCSSYFIHVHPISSIDSLGLLRLNLGCQGDGMLIFWCHPSCHKWPVQVFWVELMVFEVSTCAALGRIGPIILLIIYFI